MAFPSGTGGGVNTRLPGLLPSAGGGEIKEPHDYSHVASVFTLISVSAVAGFCRLLYEPGAGSTYVACSSDRAAGRLYYGLDAGLDAPFDIGDASSLDTVSPTVYSPVSNNFVYANDSSIHRRFLFP